MDDLTPGDLLRYRDNFRLIVGAVGHMRHAGFAVQYLKCLHGSSTAMLYMTQPVGWGLDELIMRGAEISQQTLDQFKT